MTSELILDEQRSTMVGGSVIQQVRDFSLHRLHKREKMVVGPTDGDGTETIWHNRDIFDVINTQVFLKWNTDKPSGIKTLAVTPEVYALVGKANFREMMLRIACMKTNGFCWQQGQILNFIQDYSNKIHPKGRGAGFFPFKVVGRQELFVVSIALRHDVGIGANLYNIYKGDGSVEWSGDCSYHLIVPA